MSLMMNTATVKREEDILPVVMSVVRVIVGLLLSTQYLEKDKLRVVQHHHSLSGRRTPVQRLSFALPYIFHRRRGAQQKTTPYP